MQVNERGEVDDVPKGRLALKRHYTQYKKAPTFAVGCECLEVHTYRKGAYTQLGDDELLRLWADRNTLVPEAVIALDSEIQRRGLNKQNAARVKKRLDAVGFSVSALVWAGERQQDSPWIMLAVIGVFLLLLGARELGARLMRKLDWKRYGT